MGDLKNEFLDKMARFGDSAEWFDHPTQVWTRVSNVIDAMTSISAADRTRLKAILKPILANLWMLDQVNFEGR